MDTFLKLSSADQLDAYVEVNRFHVLWRNPYLRGNHHPRLRLRENLQRYSESRASPRNIKSMRSTYQDGLIFGKVSTTVKIPYSLIISSLIGVCPLGTHRANRVATCKTTK